MSVSAPASQKPMINMFSSFKSQHIHCGACIWKPWQWKTFNLHLTLLCSTLVETTLTFFYILSCVLLPCPTFPYFSKMFGKSKANAPCQNWNFQRNLRTKRRAGPPVKSSFRSTPRVGEKRDTKITKLNIMRMSTCISGFDLWWVEMPRMECCDASSRVQPQTSTYFNQTRYKTWPHYLLPHIYSISFVA